MLPVPVVIIAGFLGAGKTSLVNRLIGQCGDSRVAVVVNDFGAINIDAELVVGIDGNVYGLANGCICCTIRDDLIETCLRIIRTFGALDLLIVEASGASDSLQVANAFLRPDIGGLLQVSAILGVVDALHFGTLQGEMATLAQAQLSAADIVVLNKVDLVGAEALAALRSSLQRASPGVRIVGTSYGDLPLDLVLDQARLPDARGRTRRLAASGGERHRFLTSWAWQSPLPLALGRLRDAFDSLPDAIYRAKGFLYLDDVPSQKILLQMVGRRSSLNAAGAWGKDVPATRIVMIGACDAFDAAALQSALDACVADPAAEGSPLKKLAAILSNL